MLPIRCFSCNKVIARYQDLWDEFARGKDESLAKKGQWGDDVVEFFERHRITRYCCRKLFLTHVSIFSSWSHDPSDEGGEDHHRSGHARIVTETGGDPSAPSTSLLSSSSSSAQHAVHPVKILHDSVQVRYVSEVRNIHLAI